MSPVSIDSSRYLVPFMELIDLASEKMGGRALLASDEFFAGKENLLKAEPAVFIPGKYTDVGKWMDGWESRRKRGLSPGDNDWCIIKLAVPGVLRGVNVDTAHFLGNYPEYCSIEGGMAAESASPEALARGEGVQWKEILDKSKLQGGSANLFAISSSETFSHIRLRIYPDGGVARLRVHGEAHPDWKKLTAGGAPVDLAASINGGRVITCNDSFFGPKDNLILPGRAGTMGDGWETQRKRGPGNDWIIVKLAAAGNISKVEVDTNHFKGNFPESCSIDACQIEGASLLPADFRDRKDIQWTEVLPRTKLQASHQHFYESELKPEAKRGKWNYIRLNIYPDGGISRLRVHGTPA